MSSEEEAKEIMKILGNSPLSICFNSLLRNNYIRQYLAYSWLWKVLTKFSPPVSGISTQSVMDKIEEFNKAEDEKDINIVDYKSFYPNIVLSVEDHNEEERTEDKKVAEISLEELEAELEDDGKEVELEIINGIGDWHVGRDTDSIWFSEAEQNPAASQEAVDSLFEVGRQIHEAMNADRLYNIQRRDGENDESFRRRVLHASERIRGTYNALRRTLVRCPGSVFLNHQREAQRREPREWLCLSCEREGCQPMRCEETKKVGQCAGYVDKERHKIPDIDCVICNEKMDSPEQFPYGFPDKWKACCYCVEVWSVMNNFENNLIGLDDLEIKERWLKNKKKMEEVFTL